MFGRLAMGFTNVRAGTRVLKPASDPARGHFTTESETKTGVRAAVSTPLVGQPFGGTTSGHANLAAAGWAI